MCLKAVLGTARPPKILINYCQLTILFSPWLWTRDSSVTSTYLIFFFVFLFFQDSNTHTSTLNTLIKIYCSVHVCCLWNFSEFKSSLTETDGAIQYCLNQHWYAEVIHKVRCRFSIKSSHLIGPFSTLCALQRNVGNGREEPQLSGISKTGQCFFRRLFELGVFVLHSGK